MITTYKVIKNKSKLLIKELDILKENHSKVLFYELREKNTLKNSIEIASRFIYLNKCSFNGMYRVNKNNKFNVPFNGKDKEKLILYENENIKNISNYLNKNEIKILNKDFEEVIQMSNKDDFIFCDPPYDYDIENGFDSYTYNSFGKEGQKRLANCLIEMDKKGVKWMLTNHNTKLINDLYKKFKIINIKTNRNINSNGSKRKNTGDEVIIINYER